MSNCQLIDYLINQLNHCNSWASKRTNRDPAVPLKVSVLLPWVIQAELLRFQKVYFNVQLTFCMQRLCARLRHTSVTTGWSCIWAFLFCWRLRWREAAQILYKLVLSSYSETQLFKEIIQNTTERYKTGQNKIRHLLLIHASACCNCCTCCKKLSVFVLLC